MIPFFVVHNADNMLNTIRLRVEDVRFISSTDPNDGPNTTVWTTFGMPFVVSESPAEVFDLMTRAWAEVALNAN
jgi:hypothetical protein